MAAVARRRLADVQKPVRCCLNWANPFSSLPRSLFDDLRAGHWAAKNPEEQIWPTVVPDHTTIQPSSENYWAPHPQTGVFGPRAHHSSVPNDTSAAGGVPEAGSVLDLKVWFRHIGLEDPEKPYFL